MCLKVRAGVDLVMHDTDLPSFQNYVNDDVVMLISKNLHKKSSEFLSKQGQLQPHFHSYM